MDEHVRQTIIKELSLEDRSEQEIETIVTSLGGLILELVFVTIVETMNDEDVVVFEKLVQEGDQGLIATFIEEHVKDIDSILTNCSKDIINQFKDAQKNVA